MNMMVELMQEGLDSKEEGGLFSDDGSVSGSMEHIQEVRKGWQALTDMENTGRRGRRREE